VWKVSPHLPASLVNFFGRYVLTQVSAKPNGIMPAGLNRGALFQIFDEVFPCLLPVWRQPANLFQHSLFVHYYTPLAGSVI
jgi:hypothetical protein